MPKTNQVSPYLSPQQIFTHTKHKSSTNEQHNRIALRCVELILVWLTSRIELELLSTPNLLAIPHCPCLSLGFVQEFHCNKATATSPEVRVSQVRVQANDFAHASARTRKISLCSTNQAIRPPKIGKRLIRQVFLRKQRIKQTSPTLVAKDSITSN